MIEPYIVFSRSGCDKPFDRRDLEDIEGMTFKDKDAVKRELANVNPIGDLDNIYIQPLGDFTTDWNDSDDEDDYLNVPEFFITYVMIGDEN